MHRPASRLRPGRRLPYSLAIAATLLGGCGFLTAPETCSSINGPGLAVAVSDLGGTRSLLVGSLITARVGEHVEVLDLRGRTGSGNMAVMAWERTGSYQLTVEHAGYARWERSGIVVERGQCGMRTVYVEVELVPAT